MFIHSREQNRARIQISPFRHQMPMQLTTSTFLRVLLSTCDISTRRDVRHNLLSSPATIENPRPGITEALFQVRDETIVGALSSKIVRVLEIKLETEIEYFSGPASQLAEPVEYVYHPKLPYINQRPGPFSCVNECDDLQPELLCTQMAYLLGGNAASPALPHDTRRLALPTPS